MKIDSQHPLTRPTTADPAQGPKPAGDKAAADKAAAGGDGPSSTTQLSRPASDASHDIDTARVAEIRDAIRDGRLEVHPERIAEGLLKSVREMLDEEGKA
ncbi:flagellar biosynthesis anti-sigma factor FlgM [Halomonas sp. V046]|uniref:flagellar biosynthesis anti-sigma factor FlgM n=1 Tax=Halomonas sp. V046 TaxID=3459611 RepID=UPI00404506A5